MNCPNCSTPECAVPLIQRPFDPPGLLHCPFCIFNCGENQKKIDEFYAWLSVDKKTGLEGLMAFNVNGIIMSAISSERKMVEMLCENIEEMRKTMPTYGFRLVRFSRAEIVDDVL